MSEAAQAPLQPDVDFGLEIEFKPHSPDPARVYRAMTELIEACQQVDIDLAGSISPRLKPVLFLEDIRTGSLTTFLRESLESIDDDALKALEWKKLVGAYLVKGKRMIVGYLKNRETIESKEEVYDLQAVITEAARQTGAAELPTYKPLPAGKVAGSVLLLSAASTALAPDDRAQYLSPDGPVEINTRFRVTQERIEEVLTEQTIINHPDMILKVKKPDFLGDSMWDFRHEGKRLPAKLADSGWLQQFHSGTIVLRPGDALDVAAEETIRYGYDQEVLAKYYKVLRVRRVISREQ